LTRDVEGSWRDEVFLGTLYLDRPTAASLAWGLLAVAAQLEAAGLRADEEADGSRKRALRGRLANPAGLGRGASMLKDASVSDAVKRPIAEIIVEAKPIRHPWILHEMRCLHHEHGAAMARDMSDMHEHMREKLLESRVEVSDFASTHVNGHRCARLVASSELMLLREACKCNLLGPRGSYNSIAVILRSMHSPSGARQ
jgi:hypothetical protein